MFHLQITLSFYLKYLLRNLILKVSSPLHFWDTCLHHTPFINKSCLISYWLSIKSKPIYVVIAGNIKKMIYCAWYIWSTLWHPTRLENITKMTLNIFIRIKEWILCILSLQTFPVLYKETRASTRRNDFKQHRTWVCLELSEALQVNHFAIPICQFNRVLNSTLYKGN